VPGQPPTFDVAQARALLPDVRRTADEIVVVRADLAELVRALNRGQPSPHGGVAEAKALEARLDELLGSLRSLGLEIKGFAPVLVDFPSRLDDEDVLLCWLEGEPELAWYHPTDLGFLGRRPLP
jgi:hypothetical protein